MNNKTQHLDDDIPDEVWDYLISKPRVFSVWEFDPDNPTELDQHYFEFKVHQEEGLQIKKISKDELDEISKADIIPCIVEKEVILPLNWKKNGFPKKEIDMICLGCKLLQSGAKKRRAEYEAAKLVQSLPRIAKKVGNK